MSAQPQIDTSKKRFEGLVNSLKNLLSFDAFKAMLSSNNDEIEEKNIKDFAPKEDGELLEELENSNKKLASMENDFKNRMATPVAKKSKMITSEDIEKVQTKPVKQTKKAPASKEEDEREI